MHEGMHIDEYPIKEKKSIFYVENLANSGLFQPGHVIKSRGNKRTILMFTLDTSKLRIASRIFTLRGYT